MPMRTPGDELRYSERVNVIHKLFDDQVICDAEIRSCESQFRKCKIKTVHAKCDLVAQLAEIGLLEAGTVSNDEGAFPFVNILQLSETPDALAPPGMEIRGRQLRDAPNGIVGVTAEYPERLRDDLLEGLFHNVEKKDER